MDLETTASQYGVVGILALLLGYFAWAQWQRLETKNKVLEEKVDNLQEEMMDLITEERDRMADLVAKNTAAIQELTRIILEYVVKN